jgi:zinc transport system ATP-binding protein
MLGLLPATAGSVKLFGTDISKFRDWYKIGYVPQKATTDAHFPISVEEVVSMGTYAKRGLFHSQTSADTLKVEKALEQVDMLEFRKKQIGDLSGGQQQRVFIARALAAEPEVIFLDEPTVGVDIKAQEQFYILLQKLNKKLGLTLVLVSHELDIVARETTEVACINRNLACYCTPKELMNEGSLKNLYGKELKYILHNHETPKG